MISFPHAKINIGLQVLGKRPDGYHDLQTLFYPVQLRDALEFIDAAAGVDSTLQLSGNKVEGSIENNLCWKAFSMLKKDFPHIPAINCHLHKVIPSGAGLGGGSADGSFMLRMLNEKYLLRLSNKQLLDYALSMGSDCPFFLKDDACYATGRGEIIEPFPLNLSKFRILLVYPGIHINTRWAFSTLTIKKEQPGLKALLLQPMTEWKASVKNDFEEPVFNAYPQLAGIKDQLYTMGALYASMSGSGSSIYGIFEEVQPIPPGFPKEFFSCWV